ncbi:MAG: DUF3084 domain-containing protein [Geitlerinemataceae cyanobacterium]
MNAGYVLILATLVLGCAIATAGDRIGSRVGKARLRLFNLRPRETATLVTTISGGLVAASTLGILLAIDKSLRTGLFELEEIQTELSDARSELDDTEQRRQSIERELEAAQRARATAQRRLQQLDRSLEDAEADLDDARDRQAITDEQLAETERLLDLADELRTEAETEIARIEAELSDTAARQTVLQAEIATIQDERRQLLDETEETRRLLADRDTQLQDNQDRLDAQEAELAEREALLAGLRDLQVESEAKLQELRQNIQRFRERRIAIEQGQVLASGLLQVLEADRVDDAILALLQQANAAAAQELGVTPDELPIVNVSRSELDTLRDRLRDRREYVVRALSTGNYLLGETGVQVFIEAIPNVLLFSADEAISRTSLAPRGTEPQVLVQQLYWAIDAARFLAQREGIDADQIQLSDGQPQTFVGFVSKLAELSGTVEIRVVAARDTFTASPLVFDFIVVRDGETVLRTRAFDEDDVTADRGDREPGG